MRYGAPLLLMAALFALWSPAAFAERQRADTTVAELVTQCREEASRAHLRKLHASEIRSHRERMTELCSAWRDVRTHERQPLLKRCHAEAMVAASVRPRGISDRGHGVRLKAICERLFEATARSGARSST